MPMLSPMQKVKVWTMVIVASTTLLSPIFMPVLLMWLAWKSWTWFFAVITFTAWYASTWDGSEKRTGRIALWLRRFWVPCHPYFPISCQIWDGQTFSSEPNQGHAEQFDLATNRYIFGVHPHGPLPVAASTFLPQLSRWGHLFDRVRFLTATAVFWLPFLRDMYIALGGVDAAKRTVLHNLDHGMSIALQPGGIDEQLLRSPEGQEVVVLRKRKGFIRIALQYGAKLVPVIAFGERDTYRSLSCLDGLRQKLASKYRIGIPVCAGQWFYPIMPLQKPVDIVVGRPIDVEQNVNFTDEDVDALHNAYIEALEALYEQKKHEFPNHKHKTLVVL